MISGPRRWILRTVQRNGKGSRHSFRVAPAHQPPTALRSRKTAPKVIQRLGRLFTGGPAEDGKSRQLIYRVGSIDGLRDPWLRRIVELGDGRTVGEIAEALYHRELHRGAGLVDIGIWKCFFDASVRRSIGHLVYQGRLRIDPGRSESTVVAAGTKSKDSRSKYARKPVVQGCLAAPEAPGNNGLEDRG